MSYLTNKKFLGGFAVLAVLAGLYFGFSHMSENSSEQPTTSQNQEVTVPSVPTVPAVNTKKPAEISAPTVNTEGTSPVSTPKVDSVKSDSTDETVTQ